MDEQRFWGMVEAAHEQSGGDMDEKCARIREAIAKMPGPDAATFSAIFDAKLAAAYAWPLWGAAYVINGGCGDDSFSDFRAALISRGQEAFERALADPDSLAAEDFDEEAWFTAEERALLERNGAWMKGLAEGGLKALTAEQEEFVAADAGHGAPANKFAAVWVEY